MSTQVTSSQVRDFIADLERKRKKLKLSVCAFCRKLDISDSTYSYWLHGKRSPHRFMVDLCRSKLAEM